MGGMNVVRTSETLSRVLFAVAIAGALLLLGLLWAMRAPNDVCVALSIYPPPPGCRGETLEGVALTGIGIILVLTAAHVVTYFTAAGSRRRILQWVFTASVVVAFAVCSVAILAARGGSFAPDYPMPLDTVPF